ncbi:MAG: hypothetical protein KBD76_16170 [Bacteriovorax sp.]|nr:hypothetical protein [Bacteriovorax sp.]
MKNEIKNGSVKLIVYALPSKELDPINIEFSDDAEFLIGLYSTLITYDETGKIVTQLAQDYSIDKNLLKVNIKRDIKTIDGYEITAEDVAFSFKRLLVMNKNTHGKLDYFLKCENKYQKPSEEFDCLKVENNTVIFKLKNEQLIPFFIRVLSSPDYVVIPKSAINQETLKIIDFRNTTGAYYFASESADKVIFEKNHGTSSLNFNGPSSIEFVTYDNSRDRLIELLNENKVDIIPTFYPFTRSLIPDFLKMSNKYNVYKTLKIRLSYFQFTDRGLKTYSYENRLKIAAKLKYEFLKVFREEYELDNTYEYFPDFGNGRITKEQESILREKLENKVNFQLPPELRVRFMSLPFNKTSSFLTSLSLKNDYNITKKSFYAEKIEDQPDIIFHSTDSGFEDNLSLLAYMNSNKIFGLTDSEFEEWINSYVLLPPLEREKMLNELHYKILSEMRVVPIGFSSYYAVTKRPWKIEAAKMYAGMPLWMIKQEQ